MNVSLFVCIRKKEEEKKLIKDIFLLLFCFLFISFGSWTFSFPFHWNVCVLSWLNQNSIYMKLSAWQMMKLLFFTLNWSIYELRTSVQELKTSLVLLFDFSCSPGKLIVNTSTEARNNKHITNKHASNRKGKKEREKEIEKPRSGNGIAYLDHNVIRTYE